jgi:hypothetical protein
MNKQSWLPVLIVIGKRDDWRFDDARGTAGTATCPSVCAAARTLTLRSATGIAIRQGLRPCERGLRPRAATGAEGVGNVGVEFPKADFHS